MLNIAWLDKDVILRDEIKGFIERSVDDMKHKLYLYHNVKELFFNCIDFDLIVINQNVKITVIANDLINLKKAHPNAEILLLPEKNILNQTGFQITCCNQFKAEKNGIGLLEQQYDRLSFVCFKTKNGYIKIDVNDIICIETLNHQSLLHTKMDYPNDKILICKSLRNISSSIKSNAFIRPHISYLVNMNYISSLEREKFGSYIRLTDNLIVPIARDRKKDVVNKIKEYFHNNYIII